MSAIDYNTTSLTNVKTLCSYANFKLIEKRKILRIYDNYFK